MGDDELKFHDKDPYAPPASALDEVAVQADLLEPLPVEHDYAEPAARRKAAQVLLAATIALNLINLVLLVVFYGPLEEVYADDVYSDTATEVLGVYGILSVLTVLMSIAYFTVFLTWFYRMYKNLFALSTAVDPPPRYTPGWAVGSWFVPIMNLFRPVQMMGDVFSISDTNPAAKQPYTMSRLVMMWWAAWIFSAVLANVAVRIDDLNLLIASDALDLLSRVLTFMVIVTAANLQSAKHAAMTRADHSSS